uniref:BAR/IMD domain-containing adapter protein 2 n=1 Tax=Bos indicus x Bos taurus TaxID=30522 RepID=A0A4W2FVC1_BOBOX
ALRPVVFRSSSDILCPFETKRDPLVDSCIRCPTRPGPLPLPLSCFSKNDDVQWPSCGTCTSSSDLLSRVSLSRPLPQVDQKGEGPGLPVLITRIHTLPAPGWKREAQLAVPALIFISRVRRAEASGLQPRKSCHPRAWASVALWRAGGARWLTAHIVLALVSQAALKKYQTEQRSKGDALDKCQAELKKLRKKSQGSKNPQKYSDKELQYIDAIGNKQGELESYVSDGYKTALTEERRRFCFLVEKQCAVAKNSAAYHSKGKELLAQKLPLWQQACADPNKIPDRAVQLMQQMGNSNGSILPSGLSASKSNLVISDPIPGAKPLPVPPELAPFVGRLSAQENAPVMNGVSGPDSEDYNPWADRKATQPKSTSPPQSQSKLSDSYSNTLPVRKSVAPKNSYATTENKTLPRSSSMAAGLERNGRMRVKAIFSHAAGDNSTLLSFKEGDLITLLVPEARDGWHYGESEKTKMRGWFPFSYTRVLDNDGGDRLHMSLQQGKSSSTGNLLDKEDLALPPPDYGTSSRAFPTQTAGAFKQRPYSVAVPAFSQGLDDYGARAVSSGSGTLVSTV